jgi:hypothetical protein
MVNESMSYKVAMNPDIGALSTRGAREAIRSWKRRGCAYASIIDGEPRPWDPEPLERIQIDAAARGVTVLSLSDTEHVATLVAAICRFIERSLMASQAQAETRKAGAVLARGGEA